MRSELIRAGGIVLLTIAYVARLVTVGEGTIELMSYSLSPFAILIVAIVVLALPETIDKLPFGPSN